MSEPFDGLDPDAVLRRLRAEAEQLETEATRLRTELTNTTATSSSPDGAVTATVSATGVLTGIAFSAAVREHAPEALGPLVMATIEAARQEVADQVSASLREQTPLYVVMGVTGSGKSTVGVALAERLGVPFGDADDFHSKENIAKMSAGTPLDDDDRLPWLLAIGAWLAEHADTGAVASCSALKRKYRDALRAVAPTVRFVHLHGDKATAHARVGNRPGHFMPDTLVESQYAALEELGPDEAGVVLDFTRPVAELVDTVVGAAVE